MNKIFVLSNFASLCLLPHEIFIFWQRKWPLSVENFHYRNSVDFRHPPPFKLKWGIPLWNFFSYLRFFLGFLDLQGKTAHHFFPSKPPTQTQTTKLIWNFWNEFERGGRGESGNYTITVNTFVQLWSFADQ